MRIMFKRELGVNTVSIVEVVQAVLIEDEKAIACLLDDNKATLKFITNKKLVPGVISKALHELLTFGYFDFTHWNTYNLYLDADGNEKWMEYHVEQED